MERWWAFFSELSWIKQKQNKVKLMINNEFYILCTGFSYSRQLILKRGSKISLKNIYYWSTILNNGLFSKYKLCLK
jgi:hypothetical protein